MTSSFRRGLRDGLPIALGYFPVSFAFGIFAVGPGLQPIQAILISLLNVTSAGQLAGVPLLVSCAPYLELALTELVINLRYALMSITLSQKLDRSVTLPDRFAIAFVNTDEVFAVSTAQTGLVSRSYMYGLILTPYLGWAFGTVFGALAGDILPTLLVSALGIAIYGMFISILIPAARDSRNILAVELLSAGISVAIAYLPPLDFISSGFSIILSAVGASLLLALIAPIKLAEGEGKEEIA